MDDMITIPKLTAQILFDALAQSMDFGSGFLDTEEAEALRGLAVAIGVDPLKGTPDTFVKYHPHPFKPMTNPDMIERVFDIVRYEWRERNALGLPPGMVTIRNEGARNIDWVPCQAGAYPYCQKPEGDPIHQPANTVT
jgi:hypothetical protein